MQISACNYEKLNSDFNEFEILIKHEVEEETT